MKKESTQNSSFNEEALTSSYPPPKTARKIQKGDKVNAFVKKAFKKSLRENVMTFETWLSGHGKNNISEDGRD